MFFCVSASQSDGECDGTMLFPQHPRDVPSAKPAFLFPADWWGSFFSRRVTLDSGVRYAIFFFARESNGAGSARGVLCLTWGKMLVQWTGAPRAAFALP